MRIPKNQKGNSKLREIANNRPLLLHAGFLVYKHFAHLGMLQIRYKQCKVEWSLSTWSDYVRYFASSLYHFYHLPLKY